jgi:hypothetical protein
VTTTAEAGGMAGTTSTGPATLNVDLATRSRLKYPIWDPPTPEKPKGSEPFRTWLQGYVQYAIDHLMHGASRCELGRELVQNMRGPLKQVLLDLPQARTNVEGDPGLATGIGARTATRGYLDDLLQILVDQYRDTEEQEMVQAMDALNRYMKGNGVDTRAHRLQFEHLYFQANLYGRLSWTPSYKSYQYLRTGKFSVLERNGIMQQPVPGNRGRLP